jgi:hypothetical protein
MKISTISVAERDALGRKHQNSTAWESAISVRHFWLKAVFEPSRTPPQQDDEVGAPSKGSASWQVSNCSCPWKTGGQGAGELREFRVTAGESAIVRITARFMDRKQK